MPTIRPATEADLQAINDIYNDAAIKTTATFDTEPKSMTDRRKWFAAHGNLHPILVAEEDGRVVGWASMSRYSDRSAYDGTAEASLYVAEECRGRGIGRQLFEAILAAGKNAGLHTVLSRITADNTISIRLHEQFRFRNVGVLREVGCKFGRLLDVVIMQLVYR